MVGMRLFSREGSKAVVLVQPYTLFQESVESEKFIFDSNKQRLLEKFLENVRGAGAPVIYLGYSNVLWWRLVELSDFVFIFLDAKNRFQKLDKDMVKRPLSPDERRVLTSKDYRCPGSGSPTDYLSVAEELKEIFSKRQIKKILVCGGWDVKCIKLFLVKMSAQMPDLTIFISPTLLACEKNFNFFTGVMKDEGVAIKVIMEPF